MANAPTLDRPAAAGAAASTFTLPGTEKSVRLARRQAESACADAGCPLGDVVALIVSELATNAVLHSVSGRPGGTYTLRLVFSGASVLVEVQDQGPGPSPRARDREACESGRGLELVSALSRDHGDDGRGLYWALAVWPA